jgi:hypothetical protein
MTVFVANFLSQVMTVMTVCIREYDRVCRESSLFAAPGARRFGWEGRASGQITAS